MSASDELDRCGEDKQEKVLQGEAGQQATQVRVLVVLGAHVQHEVPHNNLNIEYQQQATQVRVLVILGAHVQHEVPHDNLNKEYQ